VREVCRMLLRGQADAVGTAGRERNPLRFRSHVSRALPAAACFLPIAILILASRAAIAGPPSGGVAFTQITASGGAEPVSISGVVYQDLNRNGVADASDRGLPGILVTLRREDDGAIVGGTTTGPDGTYNFDALATGAFRLEHTPPPGWYQVRPASRPVQAHTVG